MKRKRRPTPAIPLAIKERILRAVVAEAGPDRGTPERAQHDTLRQGYVVSRVELLHQAWKDGKTPGIDDAGKLACERFRRDYDIGVERVHEPPSIVRAGVGSSDAAELRHLIAHEAYREAHQFLGSRATAILHWLLFAEMTWLAIARKLGGIEGGCTVAEAQIAACLCIKDLAGYYHASDNRRKRA